MKATIPFMLTASVGLALFNVGWALAVGNWHAALGWAVGALGYGLVLLVRLS